MDRLTYEQLDRIEHKQNLILEGLQHLLAQSSEEETEEENHDSELNARQPEQEEDTYRQ